MGQCTSRKATGSLTTRSTFVSHIKPFKMEKATNIIRHNDDEDGRKNRVSTDERTQLLSSKKPQSQSKHSKGVAMSFGFKRRPTPMTANPVPISRNAENSGTSTNDPNGNKDETFDFAIGNQTGKGRITPKQTSQKPTSNNPRPSRFGFHQGTTDRTNKVADIKTAPSPVEFGGPFQNTNRSRLTSPTTESDNIISNDRRTGTFTRNAPKRETVERLTSPIGETDTSKDRRPKTARHFSKTETVEKLPSTTTEPELLNYERRYRAFTRNGTKPETAERRKVVITDNNDNTAALKNRLEGAQAQMGKFTFQTTRLPQPEPIRVIETKTAKTIANNNKRSARIRQQFEEGSAKTEDDSGFGSNTSYLGENDPVTNFRYSDARVDDNRIQHRINALNLMENSDSFSETGTPPPLPELPSVFRTPRSIITEKGYGFSEKSDGKRPLIKLGSQRTFLKSRATETDSNPPSPSEHDWSNAGEAMAEDSILIASAQHKICAANDIIKDHFVSTCATVVEAALQTLVKPSISLQLTQNFQPTQKITLLDEDPNFTAVATNNKTGHLLDEEILSPVESLLSCSETEEILLKKKMTHSSSNSKDINEKLTAASPETPSNGTYSLSSDDKALSLSDDKEDFLIDDEIADQPELVFEDTINNVDNTSFNYNSDKISVIIEQDSMRNPRARGYEIEASPLSSRRRRDFLRSITGSIDSLSPCESIASDDLMMEFDISHSNDIDSCDRRSGSFSSFDDTSKFRFKTDDKTLANKNLFKSTASKPIALSHAPETPNYIKDSPRLLRRTFSNHQSSPEHNRSPKNNSLHQLRFNSMTYDPTSDCLTLTKANHSAIQQDIIGIKTMLLTLKRVLNESETRNLLNNDAQVACPYYENDSIQNHNNNNEFKVELADLRRQVIFLQGQLEDKETMVDNLQKQIDCYANQNIHLVVDTPLLQLDIQNRCNAATQTDRIRPISSGSLTFSGSSMDDSGSLVSFKITYPIENVTEIVTENNVTIKDQKWDPKKFLQITGRKIIAGMFHCPPFVDVEGEKIGGTEFDLFREFTKHWPIEYRVLKNTNKSVHIDLYALIHKQISFKRIDIGICNLWMSVAVEMGHDCSLSLYSVCSTFLVHKPKPLVEELFIFQPFQISTWILIFLSVILIIFIYTVKVYKRFTKLLFDAEDEASDYFRCSNRVFFVAVIAFSWLTSTYHSAGLSVLLNFPRFSQDYVKSFSDMVQYNIKWEEPDNMIQVWLQNTNLSMGMAIAKNYHPNEDKEQMNKMLSTGKYALHVGLTSTGTVDGAYEIDEYGRTYLRLVPECLAVFYSATVFPKNSPFTHHFDKRYNLFLENGIMNYWVANTERKKKYRWMKNLKSLYAEQRVHANINLKKLGGIIYFLLFGHLCGLICFAMEIFSLKFIKLKAVFKN